MPGMSASLALAHRSTAALRRACLLASFVLASCHATARSSGDATRPPPPPPALPPVFVPLTDAGPCAEDGIAPILSNRLFTALKSPGPRMRFTVGQPIRLLADTIDPNEWQCPPGHPPYVCPGTQVRFYIGGVLAGSQGPNPAEQNHWELRLPAGLTTPGDYAITVSYVPYDPATGGGGTPIDSAAPTLIAIDAAPAHSRSVSLTEDLVLSGATALDWTDASVVGNGHTVRTAAGYSGQVTIRNSWVTGLGDYGAVGIDVTTTGPIAVQDSIFEATAPLRLVANGAAAISIVGNEFRANNLVTYVAANPDATPILSIGGNATGAKVFQGNRVAGGIVLISNMSGWQIGGLGAGEGNIFMGPRAVLQLHNSSNATIQGNYLHHEYRGGWSQGFNLYFSGGSNGATAEHNVIHSGSWPIQGFGGTFRYNLVVDSGHDWWRGAQSGTSIHRNIFVHTQGPDTGLGGGIWIYGGGTGLVLNGNTFDGGGATGGFSAPAVVIGPGSSFSSIRNNAFTGFNDDSRTDLGGKALIANGAGAAGDGLGSADYNGWYNPEAASTPPYDPALIGAASAHDVQQALGFYGSREAPYPVREGCVWAGSYTVGNVLSYYRAMYTPGAGSPLLDRGDPNDGAGTDIGAVDGNGNDPGDLFARVLR